MAWASRMPTHPSDWSIIRHSQLSLFQHPFAEDLFGIRQKHCSYIPKLAPASDLGQIYRPKYFIGGVAIHGSQVVPAYPASHGCVRVTPAAMDMIWESELMPLGTKVVVYGELK